MPLDHKEATAKIFFSGLLLFRKVYEDGGKVLCEVGVLNCDQHKLDLTIEEVSLSDDGVTPLKSKRIEHGLDLEQDIQIDILAPSEPGILPYMNDVPDAFNRVEDKGDNEDIRWVLDFESAELNGAPINLRPHANVANPKQFKPKIFINHCKLYTEQKTDIYLARELVADPLDRHFLGRTAFRVGADLLCQRGTEIRLGNKLPGANPLPLLQKLGTQYRITIENNCEFPNPEGAGSDFRFFYDALSTEDGRIFDLRRAVNNGSKRTADDPLQGPENFSSDNFPQTCLPGKGG